MTTKNKIGLISGFGLLPEIFVNNCSEGYDIFTVAFKGFLNKKVLKYSKEYLVLTQWNLQSAIDFFKKHSVNNLLFLGYIPHSILLKSEKNILMDIRLLNMFSVLSKNTALEIFYGLVKEFEKENIKIESIEKFLSSEFAEKGFLNNLPLTQSEKEDVEFGYKIAKTIADSDIGLTIAVKNKIVVAVEAIEGTDNCIYRAHKLAGKNICIIKVARTNQDMRFDLPVIGPKTIEVAKKAKVSVISLESKKTLILNKKNVLEESRKSGIKIFGI